jgi:Mg-chelatase subunit ChlD
VSLNDLDQIYNEASLNELGRRPTPEHEAINAAINAKPLMESTPESYTNLSAVRSAASLIPSPARLRRHLTAAVKAPERVGTERFQSTGRLDLRNLAGIGTKSTTVYKRRIEDEAREAAVTLLIDRSSSMSTAGRMNAANAMALHMGDALHAAAVKFEIVMFSSGRTAVIIQKAFSERWNDITKSRVATTIPINGTMMLPAITFCAKRLAKVPNVTRRVILALTDGDDSFTPAANRFNNRAWRAKGIEVAGIGLMLADESGCREAFDGRAIFVASTSRLSAEGMASLVRLLDEGAPLQGL